MHPHGEAIAVTFILYVIVNIVTKIYEKPIVVEQLSLLERFYKSHKFVFFIFIVASAIRISPAYADYIWNHDTACRLYMAWLYTLWTIEMICVTMFGYTKIQCYRELDPEKSCELNFEFVKIALIFWSFVIFPMTSIALAVYAKNQTLDYNNPESSRTCLPRSWISLTSYIVNTILYFFINFSINYVIYKFQQTKSDLIPELQKQVEWNATIVPGLLLTSIFFTLFAPILFWWFPNSFVIVSLVIEVADGLMNHILMFYCLHRNDAWKAIADAADKISESETNGSSENMAFPIPSFLQSNIGIVDFESSEEESTKSQSDNDIFWIGMRGFHPIPVVKTVMDKEDLWKFLIKDRIILKQIARYYQKGHIHIPSLHWTAVSSTEELINNMNRQTAGRSADRDVLTSSGSSTRDISNIFYE